MFETRDTLDRTYTHPRTIKALEKDLSLSPQKLKTGFQRLYHTTPGRYVANLRMTQGALLLRTTDVCGSHLRARRLCTPFKLHQGIPACLQLHARLVPQTRTLGDIAHRAQTSAR